MKVLKFRAWDNKLNIWLTDRYECFLNEHGDVVREIEISDISTMRIQDATVELFTGLRDKNGNEIYEGDILLTPGGQKIPVSIDFAILGDPRFCSIPIAQCAIIGNVHDNPELMEASK